METIFNLENILENLKKDDKNTYNLFNKIYSYYSELGNLRLSPQMIPLFTGYFGEKDETGRLISKPEDVIEKLENQKIINVYNEWTGQGTLYNSLRSKRPGMSIDDSKKDILKNIINDSEKNCDFCTPQKNTPEDSFGRVKGNYSITASNIAKYDVNSSLVIFKKHNPLDFNVDEFSDYIETAFKWFKMVYGQDKNYRFPFFVWNCLPRSGASIVHGHAQILMTRDRPYAKVGILKKSSQEYKKETDQDYFNDLYVVHRAMGLSYEKDDVRLFMSLTPVKEKEIIILSNEIPSKNVHVKNVIFRCLRCLIDVLGVQSFNMSISCPEIDGNDDDIPYIIQIVDRGELTKSTADIGGMELYGTTVVSDDPYNTMKELRKYLP